jgi:hypothetical protein
MICLSAVDLAFAIVVLLILLLAAYFTWRRGRRSIHPHHRSRYGLGGRTRPILVGTAPVGGSLSVG